MNIGNDLRGNFGKVSKVVLGWSQWVADDSICCSGRWTDEKMHVELEKIHLRNGTDCK